MTELQASAEQSDRLHLAITAASTRPRASPSRSPAGCTASPPNVRTRGSRLWT